MSAYQIARTHDGLYEWKDGHNPIIVQWFADVGHAWVKDDETAWCAAFVGAMLKRSGLPHTGKLSARSYLGWGDPVALDDAQEGDVIIFSRGDPKGWQGHVAFFVRQEGDRIICFGGNQGNQVNERAYPLSRLLGVRRMDETPFMPEIQAPNRKYDGLKDLLAAIVGLITAMFKGSGK